MCGVHRARPRRAPHGQRPIPRRHRGRRDRREHRGRLGRGLPGPGRRAGPRRAWRQRGADGEIDFFGRQAPATYPLGILNLEFLIHAWDLSQATGQAVAAPDGLVAFTRAQAEAIITPAARGEGKGFAARRPSRPATSPSPSWPPSPGGRAEGSALASGSRPLRASRPGVFRPSAQSRIGWPWGVVAAARRHSSRRWASSAIDDSPARATMTSRAASQCS